MPLKLRVGLVVIRFLFDVFGITNCSLSGTNRSRMSSGSASSGYSVGNSIWVHKGSEPEELSSENFSGYCKERVSFVTKQVYAFRPEKTGKEIALKDKRALQSEIESIKKTLRM